MISTHVYKKKVLSKVNKNSENNNHQNNGNLIPMVVIHNLSIDKGNSNINNYNHNYINNQLL